MSAGLPGFFGNEVVVPDFFVECFGCHKVYIKFSTLGTGARPYTRHR